MLIHDPLFMWELTSRKVNRVERRDASDGDDAAAGGAGRSDEVINADAERAVLRVRLKLHVRGVHDGTWVRVQPRERACRAWRTGTARRAQWQGRCAAPCAGPGQES